MTKTTGAFGDYASAPSTISKHSYKSSTALSENPPDSVNYQLVRSLHQKHCNQFSKNNSPQKCAVLFCLTRFFSFRGQFLSYIIFLHWLTLPLIALLVFDLARLFILQLNVKGPDPSTPRLALPLLEVTLCWLPQDGDTYILKDFRCVTSLGEILKN